MLSNGGEGDNVAMLEGYLNKSNNVKFEIMIKKSCAKLIADSVFRLVK